MDNKEEQIKLFLEEKNKEEIIELYLQQRYDYIQLEEEVKELKDWNSWYSMWHNKFKEQIKDLTTELETYRPTKLHGNGQCSCYNCEQTIGFNVHWTDCCYRYKGHVYYYECLKSLFGENIFKICK